MTLEARIDALCELGEYMQGEHASLRQAKVLAKAHNGWFADQEMDRALIQMAKAYLDPDVLRQIGKVYGIDPGDGKQLSVGLVLAGNIPLVGLHDLVCVVLAGHRAQVKYSSKDLLLKQLVEEWMTKVPSLAHYIEEVNRLSEIDAVIATGSNNSATYFDTYFGKYPHIIRRNRSAVAVLHGAEDQQDFDAIGQDIFAYFGLGCRNVSHLMLPSGYDLSPLLDRLHNSFKEVILHHKYKNNYDFQYATMLMNKVDFKMTGSLLLKPSDAIASPLSVVHYSHYGGKDDLINQLMLKKQDIQCVVSKLPIEGFQVQPLGHAQAPAFTDYADNVDTMDFLVNLSVD